MLVPGQRQLGAQPCFVEPLPLREEERVGSEGATAGRGDTRPSTRAPAGRRIPVARRGAASPGARRPGPDAARTGRTAASPSRQHMDAQVGREKRDFFGQAL